MLKSITISQAKMSCNYMVMVVFRLLISGYYLMQSKKVLQAINGWLLYGLLMYKPIKKRNMYTVQDDLLARENFGDFPQDKQLANFILANLVKV